ncbi:uncharacterized protein [Blastocystis hominis]|uniref:Uncharacterized protein n=1 Tax=Blastocystis hominis TaxID=12968 RepID=D8M721_BLAHO|nr:uncharacterized protein [Blastocystis hominis]CBK23860.2 unnamed protein product [Blastocystis hominis]|eukprot:XP_012897908.1 uncharacterized protein [Blastocystis hominis]
MQRLLSGCCCYCRTVGVPLMRTFGASSSIALPLSPLSCFSNSLGLQSTLLGSTLLKGIVDAYITNGLMLVGRPRRMPKKANHGARPNSHVARRAKRPRHV